jgi:hypothetical protein
MRPIIPALTLSALTTAALAQPFTYQGELRDNGDLANGEYDIRFRLFATPAGGINIGPTVPHENIDITDGLFSVDLDFGDVYDTDPLYLQVEVRDGDSGGNFTALAPRQRLNTVPRAIVAERLADPVHTADDFVYTNPQTRILSVSGNAFAGGALPYVVSVSIGGFWTTDPGVAAFTVPLMLPDGATIDSLTAYCDDTVAGNLSVSVVRQAHGGVGTTFVLSADTTGLNGDGLVIIDDTASFNTVDNDGFHYAVRAYSSGWPGNADMRLSSVKIEYTVPGPE